MMRTALVMVKLRVFDDARSDVDIKHDIESALERSPLLVCYGDAEVVKVELDDEVQR